jgi:hypothetical protein
MKATNKLRFVERYVPAPEHGEDTLKKVCILQQWWEDSYVMLSVHVTDKDGNTLPSPSRGEWRDVPVEVEA